MASNLRKFRDFSLRGPLAWFFFAHAARASEPTPPADAARSLPDGPAEVRPGVVAAEGQTRERVLASGLRVWARSRPGASLESCTATPARAETERERVAIRILARMLERGGYRSAGNDYHELLTSRSIETRIHLEAGALVFCAKGPERELPLLLWNAAGRFARQALIPRDFELAKKEARAEILAPSTGEKLAHARLSALALRSTAGDLEDSVGEEAWVSVTLEDVRAAHERLFFDDRTTLAIDGGFSFETLDRLLAEHLRLSHPLLRAPVVEPPAQTSPRYSVVEEGGRSALRALIGAPARGSKPEDRLAAVALADALAEKAPKRAYSLELSPNFATFVTEAATLVELEERRADFHRVVEKAEFSKASAEALRGKRRTLLAARATAEGARSMALFGAHGGSFLDWAEGEVAREELDPAALGRRVREMFGARRTTVVELLPRGFVDPFLDTGPKTHSVAVGETLGTIAFRYGTTPEALLEKNGGLELAFVVGAEIQLPKGAKKAGSAPVIHRVEPGENLTKIAKKYGVSIDELRRVNGLASDALRSGGVLVVAHDVPRKAGPASARPAPIAGALPERASPGGGVPLDVEPLVDHATTSPSVEGDDARPLPAVPSKAVSVPESPRVGAFDRSIEPRPEARSSAFEDRTKAEARKPEARGPTATKTESAPDRAKKMPGRAAPRTHVVEKGDQLLKIARRYGVNVDDLCAWNGLRRDSVLFVGRKLRVGPQE